MNAMPAAEAQFSATDLSRRIADLLDRRQCTRCCHVETGSPIGGVVSQARTIRELCYECYLLEVAPIGGVNPLLS